MQHDPPRDLVIGLVNLMPTAAMRATELQFRRLLNAGPQWRNIRLRVFAIQPPPFSPYEPLDQLWPARLDGLIVTGTEPKAKAMTDEPNWPALAKLVDWASRHTISTIWSCFAAHAAVYRLDGIARQPLPEKLSGVFTCTKAAEHSIFAAAPGQFPVPHSRHNTLCEAALRDNGYIILSDAWRVGADSFTRSQHNSQFLFFQGHPEYRPDTLQNEYQRDLIRFRAGERTRPPKPPEGYLNNTLDPARDWAESAQRLSASWLTYIAARKPKRQNLAA